MDFAERLQQHANRVVSQYEFVGTEEATKNALILPFISTLGYDIFDPQEVVPEFSADTGTKKGEKVDYAIFREDKLVILIECKAAGVNLEDKHTSQLFRYFSVTEARFAILTNGIEYHFYSDLETANKMDARPFLIADLLRPDPGVIDELKKFEKDSFDEGSIIETAGTLKYMREIKGVLAEQMRSPSDEFVRFLAGRVYSGRLTQGVLEQFAGITKRAMHQFLNDQIAGRLKHAMDGDAMTSTETEEETSAEIVTTEQEYRAFYMIQALLRDTVNPDRVVMRDAKTYCSILLDDNNRKPICRLWFNSRKRYIGVFDQEKKETRHAIESLEEIYQYAEHLAAAAFYWSQN